MNSIRFAFHDHMLPLAVVGNSGLLDKLSASLQSLRLEANSAQMTKDIVDSMQFWLSDHEVEHGFPKVPKTAVFPFLPWFVDVPMDPADQNKACKSERQVRDEYFLESLAKQPQREKPQVDMASMLPIDGVLHQFSVVTKGLSKAMPHYKWWRGSKWFVMS